MKKIAYIEIDTHSEIAVNFMELVKDSNEFSVDYYFSERIFKQVGKQQSNIFVTDSSEIFDELSAKKYDLIIIGTAHRYFSVFNAIVEKFNTSVIIHNLNFAKMSKFQLFRNIFKKDFKYRLKLFLKDDLLTSSKVFKNSENLLVLDENMQSARLKFLPVFYNEFSAKSNNEICTIVVPGTVSQHRRDYKRVLNIIEQFQGKFRVIFLGKAEGKELSWLEEFEAKSQQNISITYFKEKVPQPIFDEWMLKADVLWCPIQPETTFFSNKEIYGETKVSGNIGDAIKYGKPAVFPRKFKSNEPFFLSEKENLEIQFLELKEKFNYNFQGKFNRKKMAQSLEKILSDLI